ncbi:MAG: serine/threonine protein kinase [Myxococcales bacterium]|nr:serine/threonine protein kinase [Myxococcales bacterium]
MTEGIPGHMVSSETTATWSADTAVAFDSARVRFPRATLKEVEPDNYVDRVEITRGGMGRIIGAFDLRLQRRVAIKELRVQGEELAERFTREALLTARLQHPSIVNIHEAGRWPSGEPFYAMKLVAGEPLDKVVARAKTLDAKLALLPHVLAVADALAYAHQQRVIHRDLKPSNVMIGDFGETVVIDWGLAKDLAEPATDPLGGPFRSAADPTMTADGEVLGTPAYMPPEQAEGQAVDERADVYSIGALLYHVLSGSPPYTGESPIDVLDAVRHGPPVPLGTREPGVPLDLLAIANRAMARDPAARYGTASELADDLRRFHAGQLVGAHRYSRRQLLRRWLRRHRTPVLVAIVAATILAAFGGMSIRRVLAEKQRAADAQTLAESNRADAEKLMDFMLYDLSDKLEAIGKVELLGAVADQAREYYQRRPVNMSERQRRALADRNVGDVLQQKGDLIGALASYRDSLKITEALALETPVNTSVLQAVMNSHERIAEVLGHQGNPGALAEDLAFLTLAERVTGIAEDRVSASRNLIVGHIKVGDRFNNRGDSVEALAHYRAAITIATTQPKSKEAERDLLVCHDRISMVLGVTGDTVGALAEARASLEIATDHADPNDATTQLDAARIRGRVGEWLDLVDDHAAATADFRSVLRTMDALAAQDPGNAEWQGELVMAKLRLGASLGKHGDYPGALAQLREGQTIADKRAAEPTASHIARRDVDLFHDAIGDVLLARGDVAAARKEYQAALDGFAALVSEAPAETDRAFELAAAHRKLGDALARDHAPNSLDEYRDALARIQRLIEADRANADWQEELAQVQHSLGEELAARGDKSGSHAAYGAAVAVIEKLAARAPTNPHWSAKLATLRERAGQ